MALIYSSTNNFWIKPNALNIGLNHFGNPNLIEVSLLAGAVIMAYKQDVIAFNAAHNYRTWRLNASRTFLEKDERCYVYARLDRAETSNYAQVVYSYQELDILGRATEDATATEYYYILLGVLSPAIDSDGNKVDRIWEEGFYTGSLATDQYIKEESGGDWTKMFRLNGATGLIEVLKTIYSATINVLKVATSFSLAGKTVKGIDDSKSTTTSSDAHLATSAYVDANALSSKADDTAQGKITFAQGINIGAQDITDIDTSDESFNTTKDNSLPTSKAVVKYVDDNTLSSKTEDTAQGKITFADGLKIGKYEPLMSGGNIDEDGNAELNSLKLRESLIVPEIKYNRATVFKGIQYLTFGGGVIESVTEGEGGGTFTLKLEDGEAPSVKKGDLCVGYWHFVDGTNNARANSDNRNGYFNIAGFCTIYFEIDEVNNGVIKYLHRKNENGTFYSTVHPQKGLNFACYSNNIQEGQPGYDKGRHACKITTTDYEIRLQKLYDWTYTSDNIYRIEGKLDGFEMVADLDGKSYLQKFEGHGVVFGNAYMYGTLQQFDREVWSMVLKYENDNLLSDTGKLLYCKVYRNGIEVDYSNDGTGGTFGNISYERISEDSDSDDDWNDSHSNKTDISILLKSSDLPDGYDTATFKVTAVCYSMGVDGNDSNVTSVSESVTFHRLKQGTEGRGIIDVREFYAVSDDNVNAPETGWKTPSKNEAIPTTTKDKRYLWNYEEIVYNKEDELGDKIKKTTPAVIGTYGDDGRGIKSITDYYLVSDLGSGVTTDTDEFNWQKEPPKTDPVKKYLWNYEVIEYDKKGADGKTSVTTPPAIIGTHGEKGNDGNDGKDAVQPNYMDGTSVDGTVEGNEWKVNTLANSTNPYYNTSSEVFDGKNIMTLQPSMFGRKVRISYKAQGYVDNYSLENKKNYIVLSATFKVPWVKGIAQTTADYKKLHAYIGNIIINGKSLNSPVMEIDKVGSKQITAITPQYSIDQANWGEIESIAKGKTLYARIRIRITADSNYYYSNVAAVYNNTGDEVSVSTTDASTYSTVSFDSKSNVAIVAGETPVISSWVGHHYFNDDEKNNNIYYKFNFGWTPPSNMTELAMKFRIGAMYSTKERYMTFSEVKAELWDEKRSENTAYIPSENDKARATNVNLLDGTRNGKNSEGKEIWTKATNNRGTITFGDNLFTLTSPQVHYEGNCMSITSPKITLLQGNYTLSFDMKMANCYGARLVINGTPHSTIASTTDWTTQRILLPKYSGEKTFRFDSMVSVADKTESKLYIRNIKLEEGCFGTAWTISENDKGGKPGFTYRPCGTYDPIVIYTSNSKVQDVVYYKDENPNNTGWYICIKQPPRAGIKPTEKTYWEKSSYIKFLSVEALFADNLFTNAIQSGSGYFDGLNAKYVKISGELNATKGTFHDVVINGAYNKLIQTITDDNWAQFFHKDDYGTYPLLHSWGDVVKIDLKTLTNITNHIKLPSLLPIHQNEFASYTAYKKDSEGNVVKITSHDDIRSLLGRQIILYIAKGLPQLSFFTNVFYKVEQPLTREFNALSIDYDQFFTTDIDSEFGFGINSGITLILQLKLGYRVIDNEPCEMLYWEVTTINKWIE